MNYEKTGMKGVGRALIFCVLLALVCVSAAGCMNRNANEGVNEGRITQPSPSPDFMPQNQQGTQQPASTEAAARFDWTKNAARVEGLINQISEISQSRVVVAGNTALVAVRFGSAYQGEMTERIREMIAAEVMKADPQITTVAVTADEDDVEDVYEISDRVLAGTDMDDLKEEINEIVRNATTLR